LMHNTGWTRSANSPLSITAENIVAIQDNSNLPQHIFETN